MLGHIGEDGELGEEPGLPLRVKRAARASAVRVAPLYAAKLFSVALEALHVDASIHLDNLIEKIGDTTTSELIAALFELEMLGLVKQLPGKNFVKVW